MRITRKAAGAAAATVAVALTLTACGGGTDAAEPGSAEKVSTDEDITISLAWWGEPARAEMYEEAVDLFEEKHPNITVQTQFQDWDGYWTSRATEAAGGALPDVIQMDLSYLRQYGATGQLLDLDGQSGVNLDTGGVDDSLLASGQIDGSQFGVPTSTNTLATFYNADLLKKVGVEPLAEGYTWDDYSEWIQEVTEAGAGEDPALYGGTDFTGTFWFFLQWLIQQGEEPFSEDGELNFDEAQLTEWLNLGQGLRDSEAIFPIQKTKQLEPLGGFHVNQVASESTWDNFLAGYVAESGEDIQMLPIPSGENGPAQFWKPSMLLSASAQTEQPEAAAALIDFLINEPEVGKIFGTSKGVPAVQAQIDAMDVEPGSVDEQVVQYEEDVTDVVTEPAPVPVEGFGEIEAEFKRLGEELQYGNVTVDEFVTQWFSFADGAVKQS
ncbi:ABC transporter substrate-binding protein [Krasilnikoviella flava]|uniref:Multiple sugar transport system substrate-binding protein n=1 Tax=Krasilnikoviella flava TaxID=526729 RepID=A0A1T5LEZ7_9MICO|nr:extracellular solute-binding protein [Krasilnikoviella flava]SKC74239.1 multiple sugar transport system substrate-binding protein [Krasilnikoviella flava]